MLVAYPTRSLFYSYISLVNGGWGVEEYGAIQTHAALSIVIPYALAYAVYVYMHMHELVQMGVYIPVY